VDKINNILFYYKKRMKIKFKLVSKELSDSWAN